MFCSVMVSPLRGLVPSRHRTRPVCDITGAHQGRIWLRSRFTPGPGPAWPRRPDESGDVGPGDVVARLAVLVGDGQAAVVDAAHDLGQPFLGVLEAPRIARRVLL